MHRNSFSERRSEARESELFRSGHVLLRFQVQYSTGREQLCSGKSALVNTLSAARASARCSIP